MPSIAGAIASRPTRLVEQVKRFVDDVIGRHDLEALRRRRKHRRDQLAHRAVERAVGRALGAIDQHEPAEREKPAQRLDARGARQLERAIAGEVEERRLVQRVARRRDDRRLEIDVDRRCASRSPTPCCLQRASAADSTTMPAAELELAEAKLRARSDRARDPRRRHDRRQRGKAGPEELPTRKHRLKLPRRSVLRHRRVPG